MSALCARTVLLSGNNVTELPPYFDANMTSEVLRKTLFAEYESAIKKK